MPAFIRKGSIPAQKLSTNAIVTPQPEVSSPKFIKNQDDIVTKINEVNKGAHKKNQSMTQQSFYKFDSVTNEATTYCNKSQILLNAFDIDNT